VSSAEQSPAARGLERALALVEQRKPGEHEYRNLSRLERLYATPWLHRLVPAVVALPLTRLWAIGRWLGDPVERRSALDWASYVLQRPADSSEVRRLARRGIAELLMKQELALRPWMAKRAPLEGRERLEAVRAEGRGAVMIGGHVGDMAGVSIQLAEAGYRTYAVAPRQMLLGTVVEGLSGRIAALQYRYAEHRDSRLIPTGVVNRVIGALLSRGELCGIAFDVPGRVATRFLGRQVKLSGAAASLAYDMRVPVLAIFSLRRGHRRVTQVHGPVEPAEFDGVEALHQHLADIVSRVTLEHAAEYYPKRPEPVPEPQPSTAPDQVDALLAALRGRDRALWAAATRLGLRPVELRALERRDVDLDAAVVRVRRRWEPSADRPEPLSAEREVPIPEDLRPLLRSGMGHRGLAFGRSARRPFDPVEVERRAARAWARAGLAPIPLRAGRDAFAARLVADGAGVEALAAAMGKPVAKIEERYADLLAGAPAAPGAPALGEALVSR
jgi:integrase